MFGEAGEGDNGHTGPVEAQPAATLTGETGADVNTGGPNPADSDPAPKRRGKAKRRKARRPARRVAAAEPDARAAAAQEDGAALGLVPPADAGDHQDELEETEPAPAPADLDALASQAAPVFRVASKAVALVLRARKYPTAAASFYDGAGLRGEALSATVGLRLAGALGAKLTIAAILAELVEPFADDAWKRGQA